jgi:hypothetical protein
MSDRFMQLGSVGEIVGRPGYLLSSLSLIVFWIAVNWLGTRIGWWPLEPPTVRVTAWFPDPCWRSNKSDHRHHRNTFDIKRTPGPKCRSWFRTSRK